MPKATANEAKELAYLSSDCSFLLSHLVRQNNDRTDDEASKVLCEILSIHKSDQKPILKGSEIGWYSSCRAKLYNPSTTYYDEPTMKRGVCFTDSTLQGLKAHCRIFSIKYGLAFDRDYLFKKGANPCLNIREDLFKLKVNNNSENYSKVFNYMPDKLAGYVNIINEAFDATHEREWRFLGDLEFEHKDIKFIFCPESEFEKFSKIQAHGLPVLFDLRWLDRI